MVEILVKKGDFYENLDLSGTEQFELTFSIADIKDISITKGSYSKSIVIPDTKKNRIIFGFATDLGSDLSLNGFNPNKKMSCYVKQNGRTIISGSIQLTRYIINDNVINIEVVINGGNTSFFNAMGDKLLTDIDWSEYNFKLTRENIEASWDNSADSWRRGYYFPLIDYGKGWTLADVNGRRSIASGRSLGTLKVKDFLPAVYYKIIWDKIHYDNGYAIESNFIGYEDKDPDTRFGSLIIPFSESSLITDSLFNQNKIFNVGLSQSTLGQYSTFSIGTYVAKNRSPASLTYSNVIVNADGSAAFSGGRDGQKNLWYNGYLLQPWEGQPQQNTFGNDTYAGFIYTSATIPFSKDADPLFNTYNDDIATYDISNYWYKNNTGDVFKQRFALQTDVVALWSQNMITKPFFAGAKSKNPSEQSYRYVLNVKFYRSIDPTTGVTATAWLAGTGYQIPADLSLGGIAKNMDGSISTITHWICDRDAKSNCVNNKGNKIVPEGTTASEKYLGDYCTDPLGLTALTPDNTTSYLNYDYESGSCLGWFYNSGINQTTDRLKGLWASGVSSEGYQPSTQATHQPFYSDWYQDLLLQTIYLDGDEFDTRYGASGSLLVNGNKPIQPGEMVRCVVEFGGKYPGQYITGTETSYKPPSACYLLTETNLANYINATTANPKTRFFNDVSNEYITGQTINFVDIIPKNIKQSEFIKDGIMMHNLYVEPKKDDERTLIEEPRDLYYNLETEFLDWSNKINYNEDINIQVLAETQYKRTVFSYKEDNDYYNQLYKKNTNEVYGQFISSIDNDFLTGELKMTSLFSPTPLSTLYNYSSTGVPIIKSGGIVLPVLLNSDQKITNEGLYNVNYRVLMRKYVTTINGDTLKIFNNVVNAYPYAGPYDSPYAPQYSINFGQTLGEFYPVPTDQFYDNLVNTWWASILTELGDIDSRYISLYMALNEKDIEDFKFNKLIYLNINNESGYYKVNSIENYSPGEGRTCLVTLLKTNSNLPTKIYNGSTSTPKPTSIVLISGGGGSIPIPGPDPVS